MAGGLLAGIDQYVTSLIRKHKRTGSSIHEFPSICDMTHTCDIQMTGSTKWVGPFLTKILKYVSLSGHYLGSTRQKEAKALLHDFANHFRAAGCIITDSK